MPVRISIPSRPSSAGLIGDKISVVEYEGLRFLITDCPSEKNLPYYVEEFQRYNVKYLVRACEVNYNIALLQDAGIEVQELPFKDGLPPPEPVIKKWLAIVDQCVAASNSDESSDSSMGSPAIAVHCVAGLGRAPVLVAIALIEQGMKPLDTIEYIRQRRRGAFNMKQIQFVDEYKRRANRISTLKKSFSKFFLKK